MPHGGSRAATAEEERQSAPNTMDAMRAARSRSWRRSLSASCAGALLGGCGSSTTTVVERPTAGRGPGHENAGPRAPRRASTATATHDDEHEPRRRARAAAARPAPTSTRSAPEPAFTETKPRRRRERGRSPCCRRARATRRCNTSEYHPSQTLRVLVGTRTGSSDGYGQQAFFFVDGRYIGTDAKEPSATVKVLSQSDTEGHARLPALSQRRPPLLPRAAARRRCASS